ncbi:UPF0184 protein C9orf16 homolog [Patiria miniata]|uniref:Uncharacterized protein n=1 Tax=Patiria miniata TaxID=46514 RepID=A0A913Z763_PATMI|nr:UPF0184 protein C9orf16 homolog [Patiria miniata]
MGEYGEGPNNPPNNSMKDIGDVTPTALAENIEATEEYAALEQTLDQLDSCLDDLEQKNDSLNSKLKELLDSTLQIHQEMTQQRLKANSKDADKDKST